MRAGFGILGTIAGRRGGRLAAPRRLGVAFRGTAGLGKTRLAGVGTSCLAATSAFTTGKFIQNRP